MTGLQKTQLRLLIKSDIVQSKFRQKLYLFLACSVSWLRRPLPCKLGQHKFSWNSFGRTTARIGEVYFYCYKCRDAEFYIPIDDLPLDQQELKLQFIREGEWKEWK